MLPDKASIVQDIQEALNKLSALSKVMEWSEEEHHEFSLQLERLNRNYYYLDLHLKAAPVVVEEEASEEEIVELPELEPEVTNEVEEELAAEMPKELEEEEKELGVDARTPISEQCFDDHSLANKLEHQSISDLKQAIGLNERFFFANELFRGDGTEYSQAIEELNHLGSMEDAKRLIQTKYEDQFKWDYESEAVISFLSLLNRRYQKA